MLKYGQDTKKTKADFVECSYSTESAFRQNEFDRDVVHPLDLLAKIFIEFAGSDSAVAPVDNNQITDAHAHDNEHQ